MYYLLDNANRVRQYGSTRRKTRHGGIPTGAIILHCVQGTSDLSGPDTSAENTARWITRDSTRQASYHTITDRDSIVRMLPFNMEAWHDTTSNNYSIGISANWVVEDLPRMTKEQRYQYYEQFAIAVLEAVDWLKKTRNITVPLDRMLTRAEVVAGKPGISTHGRMDPGRRYDPFGRTLDNQYEREFMNYLREKATGKERPAAPAPAPAPKPSPAPSPVPAPSSTARRDSMASRTARLAPPNCPLRYWIAPIQYRVCASSALYDGLSGSLSRHLRYVSAASSHAFRVSSLTAAGYSV